MSLGVISLQNYGVLNETLRNYPWCNTIDWSVEWTWIYSVFVSLSFFCFRIQSWVCIAFIVFFFLSLLLSAAQWFLSLRIIFLWVLATYFVECTEFGFVGCCLMIRLSFNLFWIVSSKCACIICMNEYSKHFLALRNQFGIVGWKVIWKLRSRFWPHLSWWTFCVDFKQITQPVSFRINEFCYVMLYTVSP